MYNQPGWDMSIHSMLRRRLILVFALLWLLPALACNYPRSGEISTPSQEQLRATMIADLVATEWAIYSSTQVGDLPGNLLPEHGQATLTTQPSELVATPTPQPTSELQPGGLPVASDPDYYYYQVQPGDTLLALAGRFDVDPVQITSGDDIKPGGLLTPGQLLIIPNLSGEVFDLPALFPDSEVIFSPTSLDFSISGYISSAGGYLSTYSEEVDKELLSGAEIVRRVAYDTSINPRLLLAVLEYRSGWVRGQSPNPASETYPLGFNVPGYTGLYKELSLAAKQLNMAYYAWRIGELAQLRFPNGSRRALDPRANAGTVAVQDLFARLYSPPYWEDVLYGEKPFNLLYEQMIGDPWARATRFGALFPADLAQPQLELPFLPGERWAFTGGPHISWNTGTPRGALDFAPVTGEPACAVSRAWVTASASGLVARSERGVVIIDLDSDGFEQTGWVLVYMHIAQSERIPGGTRVNVDERLGHPSCEGGAATGTHVHIARKYNGEWLPASGVVPFVLSGWEVQPGQRAYEGYLVKGDQIVSARPEGSSPSSIVR